MRKASGFREVLWWGGTPSRTLRRGLCVRGSPLCLAVRSIPNSSPSVLKILLKMVREKRIRIPMTDWKSYLFTEMCIS